MSAGAETRFAKIHKHIWDDDKFRRLSTAGKLLFLFSFSSNHCNSIGISRIRPSTLLDLTGLIDSMGLKEFESVLDDVCKEGLISYDRFSGFLFIPGYLKYNRIQNVSHAKSVVKDLLAWHDSPVAVSVLQGVVDQIVSGRMSAQKDFQGLADYVNEAIGRVNGKITGWLHGVDRVSAGCIDGGSTGCRGGVKKVLVDEKWCVPVDVDVDVDETEKEKKRACEAAENSNLQKPSFLKDLTGDEINCASNMGWTRDSILSKPKELQAIRDLIKLGATLKDFEEVRQIVCGWETVKPPFGKSLVFERIVAVVERNRDHKHEMNEVRRKAHLRNARLIEVSRQIAAEKASNPVHQAKIDQCKKEVAEWDKKYGNAGQDLGHG